MMVKIIEVFPQNEIIDSANKSTDYLVRKHITLNLYSRTTGMLQNIYIILKKW